MKNTEFGIAVVMVAVAVGLVVKYGVGHAPTTSEIVATATSGKPKEDSARAASLALLKKYQKPGPSYMAKELVDPSDPPADGAAQPFEPSSMPGEAIPPPAATPLPTPTPTADGQTTAPDDTAQGDGGQPEYSGATPPVPYDEYTRTLTEAQLADPYNVSDQQLLDGMMGMFNPEQQNVFQNMWVSMTPGEQQQWLAELRQSLAP